MDTPAHTIAKLAYREIGEIVTLTVEQIAEAVAQMVRSGDFQQIVNVEGTHQEISYIPFRDVERIRSINADLVRAMEDVVMAFDDAANGRMTMVTAERQEAWKRALEDGQEG